MTGSWDGRLRGPEKGSGICFGTRRGTPEGVLLGSPVQGTPKTGYPTTSPKVPSVYSSPLLFGQGREKRRFTFDVPKSEDVGASFPTVVTSLTGPSKLGCLSRGEGWSGRREVWDECLEGGSPHVRRFPSSERRRSTGFR